MATEAITVIIPTDPDIQTTVGNAPQLVTTVQQTQILAVVTGTMGPIGATGAQGAQGAQGATGPQGAQGAASTVPGPQGAQGPQGFQGAQGATGAQGPQGATGSQGATGPQGFQGSQGAQGATGAQGTQGPQGPQGFQGAQGATGAQGAQGPQGNDGQSSSFYDYQAKTTITSGDPLAGHIIWNNATQASATQINVSHVDQDGYDIDIFLATIKSGDTIILQDKALHTNYQKWTISGTPVVQVDYIELPVTLVTSTFSFPNNQQMLFVIAAIGPQGTQGPQGATGAQGAQGPQGATGPQGDTGAQGSTGPQGPQGDTGPQGAQGPQGTQGPQGAQGFQGPQGAQGFQGPQGAIGNRAGIPYAFDISTTDANPGTGLFRYDNTTIGSVSFIYICVNDNNVADQSAWFDTWDDSTQTSNRGTITITSNSGSKTNQFTVTGSVVPAGSPSTTYYKIPVSYVSGGSLFSSTEAVVFEFSRTGNQGTQGINGSQGAQGPQGPQGDTGATGAQGPQGPQGATGPQGAQGDTGPQGPQGTQGPQGATGSQGPQGAQGAQGPQGSQTLDGLTDVTITGTPANNQALLYSSGTSQWVNATVTTDPMTSSTFAAIMIMEVAP